MSLPWYVKIRSGVKGPFSSQKLKALAEAQQLTPDHQVRRGSEGAWVSASRIQGLFAESIEANVASLPDGEKSGETAARETVEFHQDTTDEEYELAPPEVVNVPAFELPSPASTESSHRSSRAGGEAILSESPEYRWPKYVLYGMLGIVCCAIVYFVYAWLHAPYYAVLRSPADKVTPVIAIHNTALGEAFSISVTSQPATMVTGRIEYGQMALPTINRESEYKFMPVSFHNATVIYHRGGHAIRVRLNGRLADDGILVVKTVYVDDAPLKPAW